MIEVSRNLTEEVFINHEASQELVMTVRAWIFDVFHSKIRNSMSMSNITEQLHDCLFPILRSRNLNTQQVSHAHQLYDVFISGRTKDSSSSQACSVDLEYTGV